MIARPGRPARRGRDATTRRRHKMTVDASGRLLGARFIATANCDDRPPDAAISLLVVHNISLPPAEFGSDAIVHFFTNTLDCSAHPFFETLRGVRVSAHFVIRRTGELLQFVPCGMRAWHAGVSHWQGRDRCNDFSIGVELEGTDTAPYTDIQYERLAALAAALQRHYPIRDIVGHSDIAPDRKTDPGPAFDWARFRALLPRRR